MIYVNFGSLKQLPYPPSAVKSVFPVYSIQISAIFNWSHWTSKMCHLMDLTDPYELMHWMINIVAFVMKWSHTYVVQSWYSDALIHSRYYAFSVDWAFTNFSLKISLYVCWNIIILLCVLCIFVRWHQRNRELLHPLGSPVISYFVILSSTQSRPWQMHKKINARL